MTADLRVFPRLSLTHAAALYDDVVRSAHLGGIEALRGGAAASHAHAAPVPTGGRAASPDEIWAAREYVLEAVEQWLTFGPLQGRDGRSITFDVRLGHALHGALRILPADAAHDATWSFLSLVVFPDLVAYRFPDLHRSRFVGMYPRNALRRVWFRHEILGDLLTTARFPLGEDEATGLFERTALARNRRLSRLLGIEVMSRPDTGRSVWARELYKRVIYATGPLMLDHWTEEELQGLIDGIVEELGSAFPNLAPSAGAHAWLTADDSRADVGATK